MTATGKSIHDLIPAGAHTYSRGDDQYPANAPKLLVRGEGAYVYDDQERKFLDYGMALRAVTLGYAHRPVAEAAIAEILKGNNLTRASLTEYEAAQTMIDLIPGADMVKFAKNGSTVTTAAIKLARAFTGRKRVALCAQHPFFSYDDWFIGTTEMNAGVPEEISALSLKFNYNDIASLQHLFDRYPGEIAAVILEPATSVEPADSFLDKIGELCRKHGAVYVLDEMITGFRWHLNGAQTLWKVQPDLSTFGKGMANGFSVAALVGKREIMELGGILKEGAKRVFLISTTHGAEMCGLGAFIKTMEEYRRLGVVEHLWKYGRRLIDGANSIAREIGIQDFFRMEGFPCSPVYLTYDSSNQISLPFRTLFSQEMVRNGVLIPWVALSYAHQDPELNQTLTAIRSSLKVYAQALEQGIEKFLVGSSIKPVFRKWN